MRRWSTVGAGGSAEPVAVIGTPFCAVGQKFTCAAPLSHRHHHARAVRCEAMTTPSGLPGAADGGSDASGSTVRTDRLGRPITSGDHKPIGTLSWPVIAW